MNPLVHRPWRALNWPNRISLLRLLLVAPFIVLIMNQNDPDYQPWARRTALGIFLFMAISDFVDGMLARKFNLRTRLGAILDPLADKVLIICSVVVLSLPAQAVGGHPLPNWLVVAVVGKDLYVIAGFVVIYLVTDRFRVRPTIAGKACTLVQLAMVVATLAAPELDSVSPGLGTYTGMAFVWAAGAMVAMAVISYTRLGLSFIAEGQKPLEEHPKTNGELRSPNDERMTKSK